MQDFMNFIYDFLKGLASFALVVFVVCVILAFVDSSQHTHFLDMLMGAVQRAFHALTSLRLK